MVYVLLVLIGVCGGGTCVYFLLEAKRHQIEQLKHEQAEQEAAAAQALKDLTAQREMLEDQALKFRLEKSEFEKQPVTYNELKNENVVHKRDLQNIDVALHKLHLDVELQSQRQKELDQKGQALGSRYLKESIKWLSTSLTPNNFAAFKQRLLSVVQSCRDIGYNIPAAEQAELVENLKAEYERVVRAAFEREEQARIKAQIREEQRLQREVDRELKQLERERAAVQAALDKALAEAQGKHTAEIERLEARLAEAEAKAQRAVSQAQLTKSGHVYVISNIGSFGNDVFKIGMTRRLVPMERVKELGDASVPFPFDVHMMISSNDAPGLENVLHRAFHKTRINKTNPRKEFFKADIEAIRQIVEKHHGEVQYVADAEALEYRQSLNMSEEDMEYIDQVYDEIEEEEEDTTTADE